MEYSPLTFQLEARERERERERERDRQKTVCSVLHSAHLNVSRARTITAYLVACVTSKREKDYRNKTYSWCSGQDAPLPTDSDTALGYFIS